MTKYLGLEFTKSYNSNIKTLQTQDVIQSNLNLPKKAHEVSLKHKN